MNPADFATDSWPTAIVFIVFIICVVALPTILTARGNKDLKEVVHTLTVNGGKSKEPTVLDRLHDLDDAVSAVDAKVTEHLAWSDQNVASETERFAELDRRMNALEHPSEDA